MTQTRSAGYAPRALYDADPHLKAAVDLIATLPPDQAEAVLLRVVVGLDATAAGQVLGKRSGAVRTAAHRGLRRLAHLLEEIQDLEHVEEERR